MAPLNIVEASDLGVSQPLLEVVDSSSCCTPRKLGSSKASMLFELWQPQTSEAPIHCYRLKTPVVANKGNRVQTKRDSSFQHGRLCLLEADIVSDCLMICVLAAMEDEDLVGFH